MSWTSGNVFELYGANYAILTGLNKDGKHYLFLNRMINEDEIGENYYIALEENDEVRIINDEKIINELLPIFEQKVLVAASNVGK